jgi:hypothetical protein
MGKRMNLSRRSLLTGLVAAPAVILTPGLLMPIKPWIVPVTFSAAGGKFTWKYLTYRAMWWEWANDGQEGGGAVWREIASKPILVADRRRA